MARATAEARAFEAVVRVRFAVRSDPARGARAHAVVHQVDTRAAVQTRVDRALVDVDIAVAAGEASITTTGVVAYQIHTSRAMLTRTARAVIRVDLAKTAKVSRRAVARLNAIAVVFASAAMEAHVAIDFPSRHRAGHFFHVTNDPAVSWVACARERQAGLGARAALARIAAAPVDDAVAVLASVAWPAVAAVRAYLVNASRAVFARVGLALVDVILAVFSGEACCAHTCEGVDSVHARGAVEARPDVEEGSG